MTDTQFPTETIELPSKGWFYPEDHPLAKGTIDLYYMTAKHEDILTSRNLIEKGVAIDKLLEALIATKGVDYGDLLVGDKNAIMFAARILGYGKDYACTLNCPECGAKNRVETNLEDGEAKEISLDPTQKGKNSFTYKLPLTGKTLTFRLFTHKMEQDIQKELRAMSKAVQGDFEKAITTRMRHAITAIDGDPDGYKIAQFVENMPARDSSAFRQHVRDLNPDFGVYFDFECSSCQHTDRLEVPITVTFFWPNAGV